MDNQGTRKIYIVISQTGTLLSRVLKVITRAKYNHVSISLDEKLESMYSFGRRRTYNPVWGGFVMESPHEGTFKRFENTKVIILEVCINDTKYEHLRRCVENMYVHKHTYGYNYIGLFLAILRIKHRSVRRYYCSEFVKEMLTRFSNMPKTLFPRIPKPIDFLKLEQQAECAIVFCGKLQEYARRFLVPSPACAK